jgi:hypothetical protein
MKCILIRKRLVSYVEAELGLPGAVPLPEREREAVRVHLERCPGCREEVEAIRDSLATADMVGEVEPSGGFKLRTVGLLKQEAERLTSPVPFALRLRPVFAYVVAVAALGILVAVFLPERAERVELAGDIEEFEAEVDRYARDIEFLVGVLPGPDYEPTSQVERVHLDKIVMLANSIEECWEALARNPENVRVRSLLLTQMKEEVDALKTFYEVRSL